MKQPPLTRKTPLRAKKPMSRGTTSLRQHKPAGEKVRRTARATGEDKLCRGQPCYLHIPGVCRNDVATVVPCHSNELAHGKGKGIKALDIYTVPGCAQCHHEIDQGKNLSRELRQSFWRDAYARWAPVRERMFGVPFQPLEE